MRGGCYCRFNRPKNSLFKRKTWHNPGYGADACIKVSHAGIHDDLLVAGFNVRQIGGSRVVQVSSGEKINGESLPSKVFLVHLIHRKARKERKDNVTLTSRTLRALRCTIT
jgi:hypothetical protein